MHGHQDSFTNEARPQLQLNASWHQEGHLKQASQVSPSSCHLMASMACSVLSSSCGGLPDALGSIDLLLSIFASKESILPYSIYFRPLIALMYYRHSPGQPR